MDDSAQSAQRRPAIPASPLRSFLWAVGWFLVAGLGSVVLVVDWVQVSRSELYGQRSEGFVLFVPLAAAVVGVALIVRGIRAIGRERAYRDRFSPEERARLERVASAGQPSTPFLVAAASVGVIWLAGVAVVLVFLGSLAQRPSGLALALMLLALVAMAWIQLLLAGLRRRPSHAAA